MATTKKVTEDAKVEPKVEPKTPKAEGQKIINH